MPRAYYNKDENEWTFDLSKANKWIENGDSVSEYKKDFQLS